VVVCVWEHTIVFSNLRHSPKRTGLLLVGPIILVASITSILLLSSSAYVNGINQIDEQVFHDFFLGFDSPLSDEQITNLLDDLNDVDYLVQAEPYAIIGASNNYGTYAICYFPDNSIFWQHVESSIENELLEEGMTVELIDESVSPVFSVDSNLSIIQGYYVGENYEILNLNYTVAGYGKSEYLRESITSTLGQATNQFVTETPKTILLSSYEKSFQPIVDFLESEGEPDERTLISGVGAGLSAQVLQSKILEGSYWSFSDEVKNTIGNMAPQYGVYSLLMNIDGAVQNFESLANRLNIIMLVDSIPLFVVVYLVSSSIITELSKAETKQNTSMRRKGIGGNQIRRIRFLEIITISFTAVLIGTLFSLGLLLLVGLLQESLYISFAGLTPILLLFAFVASFLLQWKTDSQTLRKSVQESATTTSTFLGNHKKLMTIFLFIGIYKMSIWMFGISIAEIRYSSVGVFPPMIVGFLNIWSSIDLILNYIAPICLILGITYYISTMGSFGVIDRITRRVCGFLAPIALSHQRSNIRRISILTFCILIVISYGALVSANIDGITSLSIRKASSETGGDIRCLLDTNSSDNIINAIEGIDGVKSAALLRVYDVTLDDSIRTVVAMDLSKWLKSAYWEEDWFKVPSGVLADMALSNQSIIIEKQLASTLGLDIGDQITMDAGYQYSGSTNTLNIVGLFGPEPLYIRDSSGGGFYDAEETWSIISHNLVNNLNATPRMIYAVVCIDNDWEYGDIIENLRELDLVDVTNRFEIQDFTDIETDVRISFQTMSYFSVAIMGTVGLSALTLSILTNLKKDIFAMHLRGVSKNRIRLLLLTEILPTLLFSVVGLILGILTSLGSNSDVIRSSSPSLIAYRLEIGLPSLILCAISFTLTVFALVIPVIKNKIDSTFKDID